MVTTDPDEYPDAIDPEPKFPQGKQPLHEYLRTHAQEHPDRTALNFYGTRVTYAELDEAVDTFATFLADRGYGKGDAILLFLQNCPQYYIGYHAAHRLGMMVSPCSPMSKEHRVEYQLNDADVEVALALDDYAPILQNVEDETSLTDVVYTRYESFLPESPVPALHEEMEAAIEAEPQEPGNGVVYLQTVLEETEPDPPSPDLSMDDTILLQYTSGTTGLPKGCEHTYWTILHKAASTATVYNFSSDTRHLAVMPIFHVAGKLNTVDCPLIDGGSVVLLTRYSAEALMTSVDGYEPTTLWFTSPMLREILNHPDRDEYDLTSFEVTPATSFGEAITEELCERWTEVTGAEIFEAAYGLSETHTMDTFTRGLGIVEEGFVGRPSHGVDIVVRDWDTHEELPRGEQGEISVKSPSVMKGYWNKPEKQDETMYGDYVLTGDIGEMTEEGFLYFLGRRKNMIKSSGYSVAPAEVEQILETHENVSNAAVVGREHESRGEEVVAFVVPEDGDLDGDEIVGWAAGEMAAYKRPREVRVMDDLPLTDVGKLDREQLKDIA